MKYRDFEWLRRVIESCITVQQVNKPIDRLILLFENKYLDFELNRYLMEAQYAKLEQLLRLNVTLH